MDCLFTYAYYSALLFDNKQTTNHSGHQHNTRIFLLLCWLKKAVDEKKMADKQFDVSPAEQRLFQEKQQQRAALRAEYLKKIYDPHRHATGQGGYVVSFWPFQNLIFCRTFS